MSKLAVVNTNGIGNHNDGINELLSSGKWTLQSVHPCGDHAVCVLAQNDQVNPVGGSPATTSEPTTSPTRVERLVRPFRVTIYKSGGVVLDYSNTQESLCPPIDAMPECISALQEVITFLELSLSARQS